MKLQSVFSVVVAVGFQGIAWGADVSSLYSQEWALENSGQSVCGMDGACQDGTPGADIHATEAWQISNDCGQVLVAVLDSGADSTHPDLSANISGGRDFVNGTSDFNDENMHGTHVTGTIAANGDSTGICQNAKILEVKAADGEGRLADSDILDGFNYAVSQGASVINASFGGPAKSLALGKAIKAAKKTLLIVAAGNDGSDNDLTPSYPASYGYRNIIVVAASDNQDQLASFSNYGKTVDIAAPGLGILSTTPMVATQFMTDSSLSSGHASLDGTSMATPHVTGAVALYWSNHPQASAAAVKAKLLSSVDRVRGLSGKVKSGGRLNLAGLLK